MTTYLDFKKAVADILIRCHVSANVLTLLGLGFAFFSAAFIYVGGFVWAGAWLLFSGLLDLLDGAVARQSGKASPFGGILDSALDRYGDGFIFGAAIFYFLQRDQFFLAIAALLSLIGAFSVSYIRARAECEVDSCRVGFWERGERLVYMALGLLLNNISVAVIILCVGVQWSAYQRLRLSYILTLGNIAGSQKIVHAPSRTHILYYFKVAIIIGALLLIRFP